MNRIFYLIFVGFLFGLSIGFENNSVFGYSFVGIASNGVEIPITLKSDTTDGEDKDGTGDGTSILDGLGVSLAIQNINANGKVYFGSEIQGLQTDIRQYVGVGANDDWAIAIGENDPVETLSAPEFGSEYQYGNGQLVQIENTLPNILAYSNSKSMSGTNTISLTDDGITVSGTGIRIIKINSYSDDILLRGNLSNADVKIVTSPLDLTTLDMSDNKYRLFTSQYLIRSGSTIYSNPNILVASDADLSASYSYSVTCQSYGKKGSSQSSCHEINNATPHQFCIYSRCNYYHSHHASGSLTTSIVSSSGPAGIYVTKLSSLSSGSLTHFEYPLKIITPRVSGTHNISGEVSQDLYSTTPWNQKYHLTDSFEQLTSISENFYLVVTLNGGSTTIKGESFDPDSDVFFKVSGLLPDIAYDVSKSGIVGVVGKTDSDGVISLLYDDVDFGVSTSPGGILKLYPDSTSYLGDFGIGLIDMHNKDSISLSVGEDLAYIPQNYVRWVFPAPVEITNLKVDEISLDYLNKDYSKNDAVVIPVIPSGDTIYATINGTDTEILMRDVDVQTQIKQVQEKSSTTSDYSNGGTAGTSSNISTSTFLTATHDGTAIANIDIKIGGSADFSMSSGYSGDFEEAINCKINYSTERLNKSCRTVSNPTNPSSITNIQSLTSAHRDQLVTALNNGQLSQLTVEVDVLKNMKDAGTYVIYTSDSAQASITSTFSEEKYGANNQVYVKYPLTGITENITVPVSVGDMIEFVIRVNLDATGAPVPANDDGKYSSYVKVTTEFGGGMITVGMS